MTEPATETPTTPPAEDYDPDAPYGRTLSGRPRRKPGRKPAGGTPTPDELREQGPVDRDTEDRAPGEQDKRRRRPRRIAAAGAAPRPAGPERKPQPAAAPPFRAGPIAKGINSLYRRAGKIVREFDPMVGAAIIATTVAELEDDVTVGEAWEEIARTNPRLRAFLLRMISGGAWGQLLMCHAPIMVALMMKDSVRNRLPFGNLLGALVLPDNTSEQETGAFGGDMEQMFAVARQMAAEQMARMGANGARTSGQDSWVADGVDGLAQP